jgi:hypothetical protein
MSQMLVPATQHHVNQAADALSPEFTGVFSQEPIERYIAESIACSARARSTSSCPCWPIGSHENA